MATVTRKLFLEVDDLGAVASDVERALFVPTRLPWQLGEELLLGLRMSGPGGAPRSLELPVVVVGRRPPRSGGLLSAGVLVRVADAAHPNVAALKILVAGRADDAAVRLQERLRLPARVRFANRDDACAELARLLDDDGALLEVDAPFVRGDRLVLRVDIGPALAVDTRNDAHNDDGVAPVAGLTVAVHVRRLQQSDGKHAVVAVAIDDAARAVVVRFLQGGTFATRSVVNRGAERGVSRPM